MRFALVLAALLSRAAVSHAQEAPPPAPPAPEEPALPEGVAALAGERPMRFFLTGGNSVVATRIGEDAEYFWVRGQDGAPLRIRKSEIARMSYQTTEVVPPRRAPERPPSLLPLDEEEGEGASARRPGRGLIIGGAVLFGIFYGGTLLFAPGAEGPGALLLIPVFGPVVYGLARDGSSAEDIGGLAVVSALQGAGALMLYLGLRQASAAPENRRRRTGERGALLVLVPELSMRHVALGMTGVF